MEEAGSGRNHILLLLVVVVVWGGMEICMYVQVW
jgi:hypothetical protein